MPRVEVVSESSSVFYGRHSAFLLYNVGKREMAGSYDPRPSGGRPWSIRHDRDPFQEPGDPLRLSIASDNRWLPPDEYMKLLRLSALPGVEIHLLPGMADAGFTNVCRVAPSGSLPEASVTVTCRPQSWTAMDMGAASRLQIAEVMYPELGSRAKRLVLDVMLHEAGGSQFIISDALTALRDGRSGWWLRESGVCSTQEAFRLAGTKARMYSMATVRWESWGTTTMNVGLWQDFALQHFLPSLRHAIAGSLGPNAAAWERPASKHLLAIRTGLRDLLLARDAVYRLVRSDGRGRRRQQRRWPHDAEPVGAHGNDLLQLVAYHAAAALNVAYSISDNLAMLLRLNVGLAREGGYNPGFSSTVLKKPPAALRLLANELLQVDACRRLLALLEVRNKGVHQDLVTYGVVDFWPPDSHSPEVFALWVMQEHYDVSTWSQLARMSRFFTGAEAILAFDDLMDALWYSTAETIAAVLALLQWSDDAWLQADEEWPVFARDLRAWDRALHRALWGLRRP